MAFALNFTPEAHKQHEALKKDHSKIAVESQVRKCLGYLELNPRHPSLRTHKFTSLENPYNPKEPVFEAYAQNRTPGAYRIFWCYGPKKGEITILSITPHP